jgi:hypothetical protein
VRDLLLELVRAFEARDLARAGALLGEVAAVTGLLRGGSSSSQDRTFWQRTTSSRPSGSSAASCRT